MGCRVCRGKEPEADLDNTSGLRGSRISNHVIADPAQNNIKIEQENFIKAFDEDLNNFGHYVTVSELDNVTPQTAKKLMTEKALDTYQYSSNLNKNYETKPVEFKNGCIYHGGWNDNHQMEGYGKYYLKDPNIFVEGIWETGELKYARIFLSNGDIYEGGIKESKYHGKGKLISFSDGTTYEGDFEDGQKTGAGKIIFNDETKYEGDVDKGIFTNRGVMKWKNGVEYSGEFSGGALNGYGELKNIDGECYEGIFENNLFNGKGKYTFSNGDYYDGDFQWGVKKGKGKYQVKDGYSYEGDWDNDEPNGFGCIQDNDIDFKTTWRNGKIVESPVFEMGKPKESINIEKYNYIPNEINLNPRGLPHLTKNEIKISTYRLNSIPSFLKD